MAFDPNQPFEEVEEVGFDPNLPFELVEEPVGTSVEQEVSQLGAALKSGIAQPLQAMGVTAETLGMPAVGAALKGAVEQPEGYVPAAQRLMEPQAGEAQLGGFAFQYLPRAIVEQVGQLGGSIVSRAAGGIIGGAAGSVVPGAGTAVGAGIGMFTGPALFEAAQIVGPVAQERAKNNGREIPNSEDLAYAWTTAGTSGALNAIGTKYLPGGEKAVGALTKRIAASFLGESATEGAQALAQQAGETILTEKGLEIQPKAALGEALIGGVSAGGATILMSPLQKEQVDIEKEADLESRDLSVPVDDPEVRANLDKAAILEQENKDSLAIINKFGVESEEGKAAQQTIVDNTDEITKINETLPASVSLPITTAEQRQIELAKEIAAPAEVAAPVEEAVTPLVEPTPVTPAQPVAEAPAVTPVPAAEVAPIQRDVTMLEQMTPEEVTSIKANDTFVYEGTEYPAYSWTDERGRKRKVLINELQRAHKDNITQAAVDKSRRSPVSAAAVESYNITLPEGYTKQGDLYVYQPTAPAPVTTPPVTEAVTPAPAPEAAPTGIAVGSRIKLGKSPQTYTIEEVLPQSETERELGEQYYSVKNERTGEVQTVEAGDISPISKKPLLPKKKTKTGVTTYDFTPRPALPVEQQIPKETIIANAQQVFEGVTAESIEIVNEPAPEGEYGYVAAYNPNTNKIEINQAHYSPEENIEDSISHELGHYIYQDARWKKAFSRLYKRLTKKSRQKLDAFIQQVYSDYESGDKNEESQIRAFDKFLNDAPDNRNIFQKFIDEILDFVTESLSVFSPYFKSLARNPRRLAKNIAVVAAERFKSGEVIEGVDTEIQQEVKRMAAAQPAPEKPAEEKPAMERYKGRAQVAGVPGIGAVKDTPKGINNKTESIIRERVFDAAIVSDNQTKKAWNLIQRLEQNNKDAGKNAQAINELTRETMQDVEAEEAVKQTIGAVKVRNELYSYAIKLAGQGDTQMLNYLLNTSLAVGGGAITEGDAGRILQAMSSLKTWIIRATEAEQAGFFNIAAQQFFGTKTPSDEQIKQIQDIFNKVKSVKIDQEKELMTELEEVGKAAGVDLPAAIEKQIESSPGLDPMVVAITNMLKMGGTFTYRPTKNKIGEAVKNTISRGITNYRKKIVSKAANGLETGFWKTLSSTEQKPGPLGELDAAQNKALGNIVKQSLIKMGLKGTPPDTKMSIYEQVASILGEQPLSQDKINMADEKIRGGIESKRQAELENATEDQIDAINLKYDEMTIAWDDAMSRSLDMPVSDTMLRRMILNELKESDTSIQDIAKLMEEEPVIGTSRQDRLVNSIIEKVTGITFQGQLTRDYTNLKTYLSSLLENMVLARQQKNKASKDVAKTKRDASGDPDKQAQAQIDKLAKIQADPTIFGEKKIDPVRNAVRDALALQLNIGFTPEQTAKIKNGWKGAFVADPNKKGIPTSFMLELQRLGVNEAAANTLADIVWRQIEVNAMNRQMEATTKAVEAGPIGGIVQAILDTPLANQQDPEWRKKVIVDYLKNGGVKNPERIAELFDVSLRKRFAKAQEEAAIKAAKSIEGGLTPNSKRALEKFLKAIRAQVLDPGKDVAKAFAEEMGWKGFTIEQIVRLNELDAIVNDNEKTDAEIFTAIEQIQKIIDKVSAPPQIKNILSSYYVGQILLRFTTFAVQGFDPLLYTGFNTAVRSVRNAANPTQFIQAWADYGRAISNFFRESAYSFKNDTNRSGRMTDYLENEDRKIKRVADEAVRKFKAGDIRGAMKDGIFGYTAFTFRTLKALDDGSYSLLISTTLPNYVEAALKNAKIPRKKRNGVMRQILQARQIDIDQMVQQGVAKNDAVIYANERMQSAITKELSGLNIDSKQVIDSAINDALARIGKTRFAENVLTGKTEEIKDIGGISQPFIRFYELASKAVNSTDSEALKIFYRILFGFPLIPARIFNIAAGYTPLTLYRHALQAWKGNYQLTYGTALQRRQRLAEQLAGTIVLLPLLALRSNSLDEEDEKEKGFGVYITGQGPSKMKDKTLHAKWNDRHDPFSLEFRMGGKTKFAIDAKAAGPLSVMIYLLGAIDDWEINRKLDGLKTSKDDWKEAQDKASIVTSLYDLAGYAVLTTARRGPTTGVMQGLVDFRRFPDDPIAAIGADVAFSAMPAVPILGTGIAKNISDFLSQPIDNTTKEGAILSNIPIVGPIAGKPALNSYGQRIGELRVSEKLKKSFGVPFTLVVSDSEEDNKLTSLTLKNGNGPTPIRRDDVENAFQEAITDDEWYLAAKTFGDRNKKYVLEDYDRYQRMSPTVFASNISKLASASKKAAIQAVKDQREKKP